VGWLNTDSLILSLDEDRRDGFLQDIEKLIDSRYQGQVSRNFVYEIIIAHKAA
jgi:hypothetical protein